MALRASSMRHRLVGNHPRGKNCTTRLSIEPRGVCERLAASIAIRPRRATGPEELVRCIEVRGI